jgi:aspartate racemase
VLPPDDADLDAVHQAYVDMATVGSVTEAQRQIFFDCGRDLCEARGAEAVILGGTDLFLAFEGQEPGFAAVDCALLHIEDLARQAVL